jgi:plastocyanin
MGNRRVSRVGIWCLTAVACGSLAVGVQGVASAATKPAVKPHVLTASVSIKDFLFHPKALTVAQDTYVTWTNNDPTGHNVVFKRFGSRTLAYGKTYTHKFGRVGTFRYHCTLHPGMAGKVIVT